MMNKTRLSFHNRARALIESTVEDQQLNARSLIITVFGDSINPHGGTVWLGSLIRLVKPFGINQRLVRTSVFRLSEKEVLQSRQQGRRSFYSLTDRGLRQFNHAAERVYGNRKADWDGEWRLVFTNLDKIGSKRETFQKELVWLGFSRLLSGMYGHPTVDMQAVRELVNEMQLQDSVVLMESRVSNDDPLAASGKLVRHAFRFDAVDAEYLDYIGAFEDFLDPGMVPVAGDEELCFLLRTLLIHRYRQILHHEPELPLELVPADSLSHRAREMTARIYHRISDAAERYLSTVAESETGTLPAAYESFRRRFREEPDGAVFSVQDAS